MSDEGLDRRTFLKSAAALGGTIAAVNAVSTEAVAAEAKKPASGLPGERIIGRPGSDFMVDVIKATGIEYIASNPASSFRSLHESIVNYGGNRRPEFLTCMHEESSVAMAHGYAKAAGKPMGVLAHGSVGLQRSEEHTSELQSRLHLVCRLLLEKKKTRSDLLSYKPLPAKFSKYRESY